TRFSRDWSSDVCSSDLAHHSSSGRLSTRLARAGHKFYGDTGERIEENQMDYKHTAKYPVYGLRNYLNRCGIQGRKGSVPSLDLRLSSSELANGKKLLGELAPIDKKTICLFTYATRSEERRVGKE